MIPVTPVERDKILENAKKTFDIVVDNVGSGYDTASEEIVKAFEKTNEAAIRLLDEASDRVNRTTDFLVDEGTQRVDRVLDLANDTFKSSVERVGDTIDRLLELAEKGYRDVEDIFENGDLLDPDIDLEESTGGAISNYEDSWEGGSQNIKTQDLSRFLRPPKDSSRNRPLIPKIPSSPETVRNNRERFRNSDFSRPELKPTRVQTPKNETLIQRRIPQAQPQNRAIEDITRDMRDGTRVRDRRIQDSVRDRYRQDLRDGYKDKPRKYIDNDYGKKYDAPRRQTPYDSVRDRTPIPRRSRVDIPDRPRSRLPIPHVPEKLPKLPVPCYSPADLLRPLDELISTPPCYDDSPYLEPTPIPQIWKTPWEAIDPENPDCTRYNRHPACGGNPFSFVPFGYEVDFFWNECDKCIRLTPVIAFIALVPQVICYRDSRIDCKPKKEKPPDLIPEEAPPILPIVPFEDILREYPTAGKVGRWSVVVTQTSNISSKRIGSDALDPCIDKIEDGAINNYIKIKYTSAPTSLPLSFRQIPSSVFITFESLYLKHNIFTKASGLCQGRPGVAIDRIFRNSQNQNANINWYFISPFHSANSSIRWAEEIYPGSTMTTITTVLGRSGASGYFRYDSSSQSYQKGGMVTNIEIFFNEELKDNVGPPPPPPKLDTDPPPPPPPRFRKKKDDCCMSCCDSKNSNDCCELILPYIEELLNRTFLMQLLNAQLRNKVSDLEKRIKDNNNLFERRFEEVLSNLTQIISRNEDIKDGLEKLDDKIEDLEEGLEDKNDDLEKLIKEIAKRVDIKDYPIVLTKKIPLKDILDRKVTTTDEEYTKVARELPAREFLTDEELKATKTVTVQIESITQYLSHLNETTNELADKESDGDGEGDDDKLDDILKRLKNLEKRVGIDDFPVTVPTSFITRTDSMEFKVNPTTGAVNVIKKEKDDSNSTPKEDLDTLESIPQFILWLTKRFDELMGQWEIPIQIQDTDLAKDGDQAKFITLPNLAEAIAEIFTSNIQQSVNTELLIHMHSKLLIEVAQLKMVGAKNHAEISAIGDYLGFATEEQTTKMPLGITVAAKNMSEFLKPKEIDILTIKPSFKKGEGFQSKLLSLLHGASVIRAAFWEELPRGKSSEEWKKIIKDRIKKEAGTLDNLDKDFNNDLGNDFDRFLEDAELGFTNKNGITDAINPYGKPYAKRPRIRKISTEQTDDGNNS